MTTKDTPPIPTQGGSYELKPDGKMVQTSAPAQDGRGKPPRTPKPANVKAEKNDA